MIETPDRSETIKNANNKNLKNGEFNYKLFEVFFSRLTRSVPNVGAPRTWPH